MELSIRPAGMITTGETATEFHLLNDHGISMKITDYGCTILSLVVPGFDGVGADIVTGYHEWKDWVENPAYFGCLIGRTCNRIGNARFSLDGRDYQLSANQGKAQLHGGILGFSHKLWKARSYKTYDKAGIHFEYLSKDGEEGFPGNLLVKAHYYLTKQDEFFMELEAETDKATPVNLTNHAYFNLAGEGSGDVYSQELQILANYITEADEVQIPTGKLLPVDGTPFDFRQMHPIGSMIQQLPMGYDDNFVLNNSTGKLLLAAIAKDPKSGRVIEIHTTEPGAQLYTANWFSGDITGKAGIPYQKHWAFALETQHFPDSVNRPEFPSVILRPGEKYKSTTLWKFRTEV
jgi:aldose 1-epimerase